MSELHFNRDNARVRAIGHWTDSALLTNIADGVRRLSGVPEEEITPLPVDTVGGQDKTDNDGVRGLRAESEYVVSVLKTAILELSDACDALGSGTKEAVAHMDTTEAEAARRFAFMDEAV